MAQYFGFDPGTYQPWALNLTMQSLGQAGVVRGMNVSPTSPAAMTVQVNVDPVQLDGICFLPNGAWCRIDATTTLSVPNNISGATRTDAVVVQMDPTGVVSSQIVYVTNWTTGFNSQTYGGSVQNTLVLALVSVPNNAATIAQGNIINTFFVASAGTAPQNYPDAIIGSERVDAHGSQPGVFTAIEVLITAAATNGQTTFNPTLTGMQVLVAQGRIGGALEVGDFAGPNGWYWPKIRGTVSGLLPVLGVDPTTGTITTAQGAASGEVVYASFKYYDFNRDAKVRSGIMFHEKTSPYLVYQGEVVEDRQLGLQQPLYDGSLGAYLLLNPGESVFFTDYLAALEMPGVGGPGSTQTQVLTYMNTNGGTNTFYAGGGPTPPGVTWRMQWNNFWPVTGHQPCVFQMKLQSGMLAMPGMRSILDSGRQVVVSGGLVNVQGQQVLLQSTSFTLPAPTTGMHTSYVVYTDRYGNITSGGTLAAGMDRTLGRMPVAGALQYGGAYASTTPTSSSWGYWPLPGSYLGWPASLVMTGSTTASPTGGMVSGFSFQQTNAQTDPNTVWTSTLSGDTMLVSAVCSGLDGIFQTYGMTASYTVTLDHNSSSTVTLGGTTQNNVRVTLASSLPYGSHTVSLTSRTGTGAIMAGLMAVDVRVPATPAPPPGTLALAQVDVFGFSSIVRPSLARGTHWPDITNSGSYVIDSFRPAAEPAAWLSNGASGQSQLVSTLQATGGYTIHYQAGPDKGIISLSNFSIDCYSVAPVMDTTALVPLGFNVYQVAISSSGLKNAASSGTQLVINAIDYFPFQSWVTDLRHFGTGHGHASELRGSSLLTQQGGRLDDGGFGIRSEQIRDRGITSRKIAPIWNRSIATTAFSGFAGVYPSQKLTITVEVPSLLLCQLNGSLTWPASAVTTDYYNAAFYLNGIAQSELNAANPPAAGSFTVPLSMSDFIVVPAGTHTLQWGLPLTATHVPFVPANNNNVLTAVAFAL